MESIKIHTSQNVDIEYELASIGDRILATLLDYVFFAAYIFLILFLSYLSHGIIFKNTAIGIGAMLPLLVYDLICEITMQGKTFGKIIMKIKVVKLDGTQAGVGSYLLRWLLRIIDTKIFTGGVAVVAIFANGKGQRIGDMAAGTTVIKMKQKITINDTILSKVIPGYTLVFPRVDALTDNDITIIKEVMLVAIRTGNQEAIQKLADKTKLAMGITTSLPPVQFLATVVEDYTHYNFEK